MYTTYGEAVNAEEMCASRYLPEGLVEGCKLKRDIPRDQVLTYADVELPEGRIADALRAEQYRHFRGESWLEEHLKQGASRRAAAEVQEVVARSEEHTSELQSPCNLVCRLLLEKKKKKNENSSEAQKM